MLNQVVVASGSTKLGSRHLATAVEQPSTLGQEEAAYERRKDIDTIYQVVNFESMSIVSGAR